MALSPIMIAMMLQSPPSKAWQRKINSPFVQDTIATLFGGKLPTFDQVAYGHRDYRLPDNAGAQWVPGDTIKFLYPETNDHVLLHELGHSAMSRNLFPLSDILDKKPNRGTYAATNDDEHIAEAFARGIASMRNNYADSSSAEKDVPGAINIIHWLQGVFK